MENSSWHSQFVVLTIVGGIWAFSIWRFIRWKCCIIKLYFDIYKKSIISDNLALLAQGVFRVVDPWALRAIPTDSWTTKERYGNVLNVFGPIREMLLLFKPIRIDEYSRGHKNECIFFVVSWHKAISQVPEAACQRPASNLADSKVRLDGGKWPGVLRSVWSDMGRYCQARVQSPNRKPTKSPKEEKKKGFGLRGDTIITWATHPPPTPPITFNHEGVL